MKKLFNRRVLLINPPQFMDKVMGQTGKLVTRWEPLGLLYIAAVLLEEGYDVQVLDAEADPHTAEEIYQFVEDYDPAVVGITCLTPTAPQCVEMGRHLGEAHPHRTVVMGNVHANVFTETLLRLGACEFICHGEAEYTFLDLLRCLETGGNPANIDGLSFLAEGEYIKTPTRALVQDLDQLPMAARHLVKHNHYDSGMLNNMTYLRKKGTVGRQSQGSRGCVNQCKFCVVHQERRFRYHSPERVVDDMIELRDNYNCGYVAFTDSIFVGNTRRVMAICDEIERRRVDVPWACLGGHVRRTKPEMLQRMKDCGCISICYGIESGSQRMLDKMEKNITLEQVHKAVEVTRKIGIPMVGLFILGLPGETREEIEQTIELSTKLPVDLAQYSVFTPYPGSRDFNELSAAGTIDTGVRADGSVDMEVWRRYSSYTGYGGEESIYVPPGMTFDELFRLQTKAMRKFYLRPHHIWKNAKRLRPANFLTAARIASSLFFKRSPKKKKVKEPISTKASRIWPKIPNPLHKEPIIAKSERKIELAVVS